jgi:hypothetical protein
MEHRMLPQVVTRQEFVELWANSALHCWCAEWYVTQIASHLATATFIRRKEGK